jgi:predicted amidophosphoribosyltransferase
MLSHGNVLPAQLRRAAGAAHSALRRVDLALPPLCPACREPVDGRGLCAGCWSKLSFITRPYCERLGTPFVYDPGPGILSMEAIADPPGYNRARAAVRFDEISRALVHALKYGDRLDLAPMMGRWISQAGREVLAEADALVPVPLHWRRLWARRFNQSAMLAAAISRQSPRPGRRRRAQAGQADRTAGRLVAERARRQCPGRLPCTRRRQSRGDRPAPGSHRRRADIRSDRRRLRQGAIARRRRKCRCAGFCQGCRAGTNVHIRLC